MSKYGWKLKTNGKKEVEWRFRDEEREGKWLVFGRRNGLKFGVEDGLFKWIILNLNRGVLNIIKEVIMGRLRKGEFWELGCVREVVRSFFLDK